MSILLHWLASGVCNLALAAFYAYRGDWKWAGINAGVAIWFAIVNVRRLR